MFSRLDSVFPQMRVYRARSCGQFNRNTINGRKRGLGGWGGAEEKGRVNKQPPSCQLFLLFLEHLSQRKRRKRWTGSEEGKEITERR